MLPRGDKKGCITGRQVTGNCLDQGEVTGPAL